MENNNKKKSPVALILAIIAIVICLVLIGGKIISGIQNDKKYSEIQSMAANTSEDVTDKKVKNPINFPKLLEHNEDIIGWIKIDDTNVDYPIAQYTGDDQAYYLYRNIDKEKSQYGAIYTERKNSPNFDDRVTLVYGHNMNNGSMFNNLHKFSEQEFFDKHQYFTVCTPNHILTYEVISAFEYDDRHILNSFDFSDDKVYEGFLETLKSPHSLVQKVREDVELTTDDKVIILSTCVNTNDYARYLVCGKLVSNQETE